MVAGSAARIVSRNDAGRALITTRKETRMILANPLKGAITSGYNPKRLHPVAKVIAPHWGTDIGGRPRGGTHTIHAAARGKVIAAYGNYQNDSAATRIARRYLSRLTGNHVLIEHADVDGKSFRTYYGHLDRVSVKVGQTVEAGDVIGTQGATGDVSGAHLHLEVWIGGQTVDPVPFFKANGATLGSGSTDRIEAIMAKLDKDDYENIARAFAEFVPKGSRLSVANLIYQTWDKSVKSNNAVGRIERAFSAMANIYKPTKK